MDQATLLQDFRLELLHACISHILSHTLWVVSTGAASKLEGQCYSSSVRYVRDSIVATGWTIRGSYPGGDEIFRTRPKGRWGPPSLLYSGYRVKRPGRGVEHPPLSIA
jgi:hypothetical protein